MNLWLELDHWTLLHAQLVGALHWNHMAACSIPVRDLCSRDQAACSIPAPPPPIYDERLRVVFIFSGGIRD